MTTNLRYQILETSSSAAGAARSTGSAVLTAGLLVAGLGHGHDPSHIRLNQRDYKIEQSLSTFGNLSNVFSGAYNSKVVDFESQLSTFYSSLLAKQEPLGKAFEEILHENAWDLYVVT